MILVGLRYGDSVVEWRQGIPQHIGPCDPAAIATAPHRSLHYSQQHDTPDTRRVRNGQLGSFAVGAGFYLLRRSAGGVDWPPSIK
jgi:hypothetical protein